MFILGISNALLDVPVNTLVQDNTPLAIRSRIYGVISSIIGVAAIFPIIMAESRAYCFGRLQEATADAPYRVEEHMSLTRVRGDITGTKSGTQAGPDMTNGFTGTMTGEAKDGYLQFIYAYTIDGSKQKELEVYRINGADLVKQRYTLDLAKKDGEEVLIPNLSSTPTLITYTAEACT
jgi:hypothetical protein